MHGTYLRCIGHGCGLEYPIGEKRVECDKGHLLDVTYSDTPAVGLKETFQSRRNSGGNIFDESGVWRYRELFNFCQIDTKSYDECSKNIVSLDGSEGRQSKPYSMARVAKYTGILRLLFLEHIIHLAKINLQYFQLHASQHFCRISSRLKCFF